MKSVLYVGAALMIGASIYGFVDYKHTRNKKEFKEMYSVAKTPAQEPDSENLQEEKEIKPVADTKVAANEAVKKSAPVTTKKAKKKIKKKRVLETRFFSRGGLDDEYVEPIKEKKDPPLTTISAK
jgi:hypothetical protein